MGDSQLRDFYPIVEIHPGQAEKETDFISCNILNAIRS